MRKVRMTRVSIFSVLILPASYLQWLSVRVSPAATTEPDRSPARMSQPSD